VRFIDAFVASLDRHALGFAKAIPAYTGAPPYHPGESAAPVSLRLPAPAAAPAARWNASAIATWNCSGCLRKLAPDFKTIADFRRDQRASFKLSIASSIGSATSSSSWRRTGGAGRLKLRAGELFVLAPRPRRPRQRAVYSAAAPSAAGGSRALPDSGRSGRAHELTAAA